jgi:hypothetical protein
LIRFVQSDFGFMIIAYRDKIGVFVRFFNGLNPRLINSELRL